MVRKTASNRKPDYAVEMCGQDPLSMSFALPVSSARGIASGHCKDEARETRRKQDWTEYCGGEQRHRGVDVEKSARQWMGVPAAPV
jgi:hypothetical protein